MVVALIAGTMGRSPRRSWRRHPCGVAGRDLVAVLDAREVPEKSVIVRVNAVESNGFPSYVFDLLSAVTVSAFLLTVWDSAELVLALYPVPPLYGGDAVAARVERRRRAVCLVAGQPYRVAKRRSAVLKRLV